VKIWTAHEKPRATPILVPEGFAFGALFFGPFWLAAHKAWIPAAAVLALTIALLVMTDPPASVVLFLGLAVLVGFSARDLVRWSVARRGYLESGVITGRNEDEAQSKLLAARPDLVERSMVAETAP